MTHSSHPARQPGVSHANRTLVDRLGDSAATPKALLRRSVPNTAIEIATSDEDDQRTPSTPSALPRVPSVLQPNPRAGQRPPWDMIFRTTAATPAQARNPATATPASNTPPVPSSKGAGPAGASQKDGQNQIENEAVGISEFGVGMLPHNQTLYSGHRSWRCGKQFAQLGRRLRPRAHSQIISCNC